MGYALARIILYVLVFCFSAVLIGLTGRRINFTRSQPIGFHDPIVVDILVTSALALMWSAVWIIALLARIGGIFSFLLETLGLALIWIFYLVANSIASNKFAHLGGCRSTNICKVLTAMLAFAWINWVTILFLILISIGHMAFTHVEPLAAAHGEKAAPATETREREAA
ncbi:hypothetical protein AX17_003795 [Amanita inopinata Kibby_2008]|nr:hypothetical protein AX17_003795 [Amanita inopinata Kibby_2008]